MQQLVAQLSHSPRPVAGPGVEAVNGNDGDLGGLDMAVAAEEALGGLGGLHPLPYVEGPQAARSAGCGQGQDAGGWRRMTKDGVQDVAIRLYPALALARRSA